jgi:hypothetical protein
MNHPGNRLSQLRELASSRTSLTSDLSQPSQPSQGFQYQRQRNKRKANHVTGTSLSGKFSGAPEPSRDIFVYRVSKETTESDIEEYMSENEITVRGVSTVSHDTAKFSSYKVEIKKSDLDRALKAEFWPIGVCVRRYYAPKNSQSWQ